MINELKKALSDHYRPKRKVIAERYKFYKRNQKFGESINDYILELKLLARSCKFENVDITLRDRLVMVLVDTHIQNKLLDAEDDLTLELALSKAANMELTSAEVKNIKPEKMDVNRGRDEEDDTVIHMGAITLNWVTLEEENNTSYQSILPMQKPQQYHQYPHG